MSQTLEDDRLDELKWRLMVELSSSRIARMLRDFAPGARVLVVLAVDETGEQQVEAIDATRSRSLGIEWPMHSGQLEVMRVCVYCSRPGKHRDLTTQETICAECAHGIEPGELGPL